MAVWERVQASSFQIGSVQDRDLHLHLAPVFQLLRSCDRKALAGPALTRSDVQILKDAMPAFVSPLVDWFIVKAGFGSDINTALGISYARSQHVNHRFDMLCHVELPKLRIEAEARVIHHLRTEIRRQH